MIAKNFYHIWEINKAANMTNQSAAESYVLMSVASISFSHLLFPQRKELTWGCKGVGKKTNVSFGRENVKGQKRKVMSASVALTQQYISWAEGMTVVGGNREVFLIHWYSFIISLSPEQGAGWLTGLLGGTAWADGANGIRTPSLISQLWWLADRSWWIAGAEGSPDSHAWLMNCEMRQTYKSCG